MMIEWYYNTDDKKKVNKSPLYVKSTDCTLYGTCDLENPSFIVSGIHGDYVKYKDTYYFIDKQIYSNGKWIISCIKDVLYTNRLDINNLECLIARCEDGKINDIVDNNIVMKVDRDIKHIQFRGGQELGRTGADVPSTVIIVNG